jgi:hypothetical protein
MWELWARVCDSGGDSKFSVAESFGLNGGIGLICFQTTPMDQGVGCWNGLLRRGRWGKVLMCYKEGIGAANIIIGTCVEVEADSAAVECTGLAKMASTTGGV